MDHERHNDITLTQNGKCTASGTEEDYTSNISPLPELLRTMKKGNVNVIGLQFWRFIVHHNPIHRLWIPLTRTRHRICFVSIFSKKRVNILI
jgi:hypothetical protein